MRKIYIIRHGRTDMNIEHRLQGQINTSLNDDGKAQAVETGKKLKAMELIPDIIYSSPLERCLQTAEGVTGRKRDQMIIDDRLIEMNFGENESKRVSELPKDFYRIFFDEPQKYQVPKGGESFEEVIERTGRFIEDLKKDACIDDKTVFVFSHGAAIHAMISYFTKAPVSEFWKIPINNLEVIQFLPGQKPGEMDGYEVVSEGFFVERAG